MRIITGDYRGRKLEAPMGNDVRPTSDKVKEAVFNIIQQEIRDAVCVDLFAGTGSLGLEALSRGAKKCYFCDNSRESINLVKTNIKKCGAENKSVVLAGDYTKALARVRDKADIFFLDPPYSAGLYEKCFELIETLDLLSGDGLIIAEHGVRDFLPEQIGTFQLVKERKYGKIMVSIYRYTAEDELKAEEIAEEATGKATEDTDSDKSEE